MPDLSVTGDRRNVDDAIRIAACGDVMLGACALAGMPERFQIPYFLRRDLITVSPDIVRLFERADRSICNFEGAITRAVLPYTKKNFIAPEAAIDFLKRLHIGIVSLANNHMNDCGQAFVSETQQLLAKGGISYLYSPAHRNAHVIETIRGRKVAFIGYGLKPHFTFETCNRFDPDNYIDLDLYLHSIDKLAPESQVEPLGDGNIIPLLKLIEDTKREGADVVVLYVHWGYAQLFLPSLFQISVAHRLIDLGVDCILGAHPHVIQPIEIYKGKPIFYSLGNFVFDMWRQKNRTGMVGGIRIGNPITFDCHYCRMNARYQISLEGTDVYRRDHEVGGRTCTFLYPPWLESEMLKLSAVAKTPHAFFGYRQSKLKRDRSLVGFFRSDVPFEIKLRQVLRRIRHKS